MASGGLDISIALCSGGRVGKGGMFEVTSFELVDELSWSSELKHTDKLT